MSSPFVEAPKTNDHLLKQCVCGSKGFDGGTIHGVSVLRCTSCGVIRQRLWMDEAALSEWYRTEYFNGTYLHTFEHDLEVAKKRLDAYQITCGAKLLDVGSGNGAFITAARARSIDAWGQDLSETHGSEFVYNGSLEDIAFPTDGFDVVVMHDVLEHLVRPLDTLKEVRRILRRPGKLIIDFPRFHHESGAHHWKWPEHLWMFTEEQLVRLVEVAGFRVTATSTPIPSKFVVEAEALPERRPQILTPPGIGDSWWAITKLPGFLKHHGLGLPDVWVQDSGGPKRTQPFLDTIPFLHAAGYKKLSDRSAVFHEAYVENGRTVFTTVPDIDYFIAYNGILRAGRSLEEVDPEYGVAWRPKMHVSKAATAFRDNLRGPGEYIITYYAEAGMYRAWLAQFPPDKIVKALRILEEDLQARIIFIGAPWDRGQVGREIAKANPDWTDLIGATSFDQMLGAIMGAKAVVGYPAGNTMLGTVLNVPTVLLWNEYFDPRFWTYSCPPNAPYAALDTRNLEVDTLVRTVKEVVNGRAS